MIRIIFSRFPFFIAHWLILVGTTNGQVAIPDETFPIPRDKASFIYHPPSKALLLVGGSPLIPDSISSDVWKWDGKRWSKIKADGPGSRAFFPGALETGTNLIHAFGGVEIKMEGLDLRNAKGDTWVFDGDTWSLIPAGNIGIRHHHNMVYADHLRCFVLYGGYDNGPDTVTWLMRSGQFTPLYLPGPGVRYHTGMAYDKYRKKVVLYGGGEGLNEHWEFDGTKWEQIITKENPGPRRGHSMIYHDELKMVILHGGWASHSAMDPRNSDTPVTWGWNGSTWKKITEARIFSAALGYDKRRKVVVAFGFSDHAQSSNLMLWELKNDEWIRVTDYGKWNATDYLKQRVEQNPDDNTARVLYADRLRMSGQFAMAETEYKKIRIESPQNIQVLINLTEVLLKQGKTVEAEEYIGSITEAGLMSRDNYIRLAGSFMAAKDFREGAKYYEKALEIESRGGDFYNLACAYALLNDKDKSFEKLDRAIEHGFNRKADYENDSDLESLKSDGRWKILVEKLK